MKAAHRAIGTPRGILFRAARAEYVAEFVGQYEPLGVG